MTRAECAAGQLPLVPDPAPATPEQPRLRVLVPCSKWKRPSPSVASRDDLDLRRDQTQARLASLSRPARDMYVGRAYQRALAAVDKLAGARQDIPLALHIASAGYGVLDANEFIVPYEATMGSRVRDWEARGARLAMPERVTALIESADAMIIALSQPYYVGGAFAALKPSRGLCIAIGTGEPPISSRCRQVLAGRRQARALGTTEREVASIVLSHLLDWVGSDGIEVLTDLPPEPLDWPAR